MDFLALLAPIAFVFAIVAVAKVGILEKEIKTLKDKLENKE